MSFSKRIDQARDAYKKGDKERAIADFDTAIKLNPKDADVYTNRGLAYFDKGQYDRAIADLERIGGAS